MSGETPGDGWPSRGLLVQGALFARTKDSISAEDEKTKGHSTP